MKDEDDYGRRFWKKQMEDLKYHYTVESYKVEKEDNAINK